MKLPALGIVLLAIGLYAVTLGGDFVYDDRSIVRDDPRMSQPGGLSELFWSEWIPGSPGPLWRPLTLLSFAGQWRAHGVAPWAFHLVNVLLYAGMCALVSVLIHQITRDRTAAWIGGLLFAAHPIHVEAVAYLVGRAEVLSALGVVGGLVLMLSHRFTVAKALGIVGCFVVAVGAKEHGVLLAPMLLAIWLWRRREMTQDKTALALVFAGVSGALMVYIAMRESVASLFWDRFFLEWTINPVARARGLDRLLLPIEILGRYVALFLLPVRLSPDYGANVIGYRVNLAGVHFYLGLMALLAWLGGLVAAWRSRRGALLVLLALMGISYSLISNTFFLIGISMGERLAFLTSVFAAALLGWGIARLPRPLATGVTAVLLVAGAVRTVSYAWLWNDELRLLTHSRQRHPQSIQLHYLLAFYRYERDELEQAEAILAEARGIGPESKHVFALSARVAEARGDIVSAELFRARAMDLTIEPPHLRGR